MTALKFGDLDFFHPVRTVFLPFSHRFKSMSVLGTFFFCNQGDIWNRVVCKQVLDKKPSRQQ